jgi:aspartyl/asparaginyl beta-hydroxylase (cupin superfamily)
MFSKTDKVGNIEYLERKLQELGESQANSASYWLKLSEHCSKLSSDQLKYVHNCDKVKKAKSKMMEAFNLFLFERYKEDFAQVETIRPICDEYVNTILQVADDYGDVMKRTLEENEKLKAKIQELERKNAKQNTTRA